MVQSASLSLSVWAPCRMCSPENSTATHTAFETKRERKSACSHPRFQRRTILQLFLHSFLSDATSICVCVLRLYKQAYLRESAREYTCAARVCVEGDALRESCVCKRARAPRNSRPTSHIKSRSATDEYPSERERDRNSNHRLRRIFIHLSLS
jgi:hypothetical protein